MQPQGGADDPQGETVAVGLTGHHRSPASLRSIARALWLSASALPRHGFSASNLAEAALSALPRHPGTLIELTLKPLAGRPGQRLEVNQARFNVLHGHLGPVPLV